MKRIYVLMLVLMSFAVTQVIAVPVLKKEKLTAEQRAEKTTNKLDSIVSLTNKQKKQVYNLALDKAKKMDEIRLKYKGNKEAKEQRKADMKLVKKEFKTGLERILTEEQSARLKAYKKEHKTDLKKYKRSSGHKKRGK